MELFKGMTDEQRDRIIIPALKKFAMEKHDLLKPLCQCGCCGDADDEIVKETIAWEFLCQNLGIEGFEWS